MPWVTWILSNVVLASLLALTAWFVQRRLRRPSVARILWVLVLVKLVTPPLVSVPFGEISGKTACAIGACGCAQHAGTLTIVGYTLPIKRGDHLVRMLELTIGVVYWWLPGTGSIGRQLRACEETCCDAAVVSRLPQARRDYARLLLDVADFADPLPRQAAAAATAMSAADDLEARLRAILDGSHARRRSWPAGVLAFALAFAILPCELRYGFSGSDVVERPAAVGGEGVAAGFRSRGGEQSAAMPVISCCPS